MGKITAIFPGFNVEPGNCSLTVCDYDFLKRKLGDKLGNYGAGFDREMGDRFSGKKLKLHHIRKLKGGPLGAMYHFYFSDGSDTYTWNEYMFKEYWNAGGRVEYVSKTDAVKRDIRSFSYEEEITDTYERPKLLERLERECYKQPDLEDSRKCVEQPSKMSKLFKLMFIMNMMNGKK